MLFLAPLYSNNKYTIYSSLHYDDFAFFLN